MSLSNCCALLADLISRDHPKLDGLQALVLILEEVKRIIHEGGEALHDVSDHRNFLGILCRVMEKFAAPSSSIQDSAQCLGLLRVIYELVDNLFGEGSCTNQCQLENPYELNRNGAMDVLIWIKNVIVKEMKKFTIDNLLEKTKEEQNKTSVRQAVALLYRDCEGSFMIRCAQLSTDNECSSHYEDLKRKSQSTSVERLFKNNPERLCAVCDEFELVPRGDFAALDCCEHLFCKPCAIYLFSVFGCRRCILCSLPCTAWTTYKDYIEMRLL